MAHFAVMYAPGCSASADIQAPGAACVAWFASVFVSLEAVLPECLTAQVHTAAPPTARR